MSGGPNLTLEQTFDDLEPWGYGEGLEAPVNVYVINVGLPLVVVAVFLGAWWRSRRRAVRAAAAEAGADALPDGQEEVVVRGTVCDVDGGDVAVRVTIEQAGRDNQDKNSKTVIWTEIARDTEARPFSLELANGSRLRVEPGDEPLLVDDLGKWVRSETDKTTRTATAALTIGEKVFAIGEIGNSIDPAAGYRGGETKVLRPPKSGPMQLSTHGLAAPFRERARRFANWALAMTAATLLLQVAAVQFHVALWFGGTQSATIEERWLVKGSKKSKDARYVTYRLASTSELVQDEIEEHDWDRLAPGTVVPVHVSPLETTLGPHPTITGVIPMLSTVALVVLGAIGLSAAFRKRKWYERRLDAVVNGQLSDG